VAQHTDVLRDDHRHEFRDGVIDGRADRARRAVDVLQGGGDTLEERDRALGTELRIDARDQRDLGDGLVQTGDRWLRLPPERVSPKSRFEAPRVTAGLRHGRQRHSIDLSDRRRVRGMRLRYSDGRNASRESSSHAGSVRRGRAIGPVRLHPQAPSI